MHPATGNQWYRDGNIIAGAKGQTYLATESGSYTVTSLLNGCTSDFSAPYNFALAGTINLGNGQYIRLYPNPVTSDLNISANISSGMAIDMSKLPQGFYLVKIYCNGPVKINETVKIFKGN